MKKLAAVLFAAMLSACGVADLGEECDTKGATDDECVENAICTPVGDVNKCLKTCTADTDCTGTNEGCLGVAGSNIKSCQTKS